MSSSHMSGSLTESLASVVNRHPLSFCELHKTIDARFARSGFARLVVSRRLLVPSSFGSDPASSLGGNVIDHPSDHGGHSLAQGRCQRPACRPERRHEQCVRGGSIYLQHMYKSLADAIRDAEAKQIAPSSSPISIK